MGFNIKIDAVKYTNMMIESTERDLKSSMEPMLSKQTATSARFNADPIGHSLLNSYDILTTDLEEKSIKQYEAEIREFEKKLNEVDEYLKDYDKKTTQPENLKFTEKERQELIDSIASVKKLIPKLKEIPNELRNDLANEDNVPISDTRIVKSELDQKKIYSEIADNERNERIQRDAQERAQREEEERIREQQQKAEEEERNRIRINSDRKVTVIRPTTAEQTQNYVFYIRYTGMASTVFDDTIDDLINNLDENKFENASFETKQDIKKAAGSLNAIKKIGEKRDELSANDIRKLYQSAYNNTKALMGKDDIRKKTGIHAVLQELTDQINEMDEMLKDMPEEDRNKKLSTLDMGKKTLQVKAGLENPGYHPGLGQVGYTVTQRRLTNEVINGCNEYQNIINDSMKNILSVKDQMLLDNKKRPDDKKSQSYNAFVDKLDKMSADKAQNGSPKELLTSLKELKAAASIYVDNHTGILHPISAISPEGQMRLQSAKDIEAITDAKIKQLEAFLKNNKGIDRSVSIKEQLDNALEEKDNQMAAEPARDVQKVSKLMDEGMINEIRTEKLNEANNALMGSLEKLNNAMNPQKHGSEKNSNDDKGNVKEDVKNFKEQRNAQQKDLKNIIQTSI